MRTAALRRAFLGSTLLPAVLAAQAPHLGYYDHTDPPDSTTFTVTIERGSAADSVAPGVWLLHCHIGFHMEVGMGLVVQVGEWSQFPRAPRGFPTCGNFLPGPEETQATENVVRHPEPLTSRAASFTV